MQGMQIGTQQSKKSIRIILTILILFFNTFSLMFSHYILELFD